MKIKSVVTVLVFLISCASAHGSEGLFSYIYTAETTPAGNWEYEQKQTLRSGKAKGEYTALDLRNEFEYGITDFLQGALYINSTYNYIKGVYDPEDVSHNLVDTSDFNINSVSIEFMYRFLSPYKDGLGLALYIEPELNVRDRQDAKHEVERAIEGRIIVQKNFLDDLLVTATNIMFEPEWVVDNGEYSKELWAEWTLGASYRIKSNWFIGLEFRNHMEFVDMNFKHQEHSAYFFGPTLHYGSENYWWTITFLPQVSGWPRDLGVGADGSVISSSYAHLGQHEKFEIKVAFGIPLGEEHKH